MPPRNKKKRVKISLTILWKILVQNSLSKPQDSKCQGGIMKSLKLVMVAFLIGHVTTFVFGATGKSPMGPNTMGQPSYSSGGSTRTRINLIGEGEGSASRDSNPKGLAPSRNPDPQEQQAKEENNIQLGPYNQQGEYQYWKPE
jgi:hypothetical protein